MAGMEKVVTYSPAYTLVPTYECFNRCTYCNFRRDPNQDEWMMLAAAKSILDTLLSKNSVKEDNEQSLKNQSLETKSLETKSLETKGLETISEILILSGEVQAPLGLVSTHC
jgi:hypothetical protein